MSGTKATDAAAPTRAERLRAAIAGDYGRLCRAVAPLVWQTHGPLRFDQLRERVEEVVAEAVGRALARAESYDPNRPAFPWVMTFAANVFHESRRAAAAARRRQVPQTDLGDCAWEQALQQQFSPAADAATATATGPDGTDFRRLARAVATLAEADRRLLELRYERCLDGASLARAIGAPSAGAARVRLCRALKLLREAFRREAVSDDDREEATQ